MSPTIKTAFLASIAVVLPCFAEDREIPWSFRPLARPAVIDKYQNWALDPLDGYIAARLESAGLRPNPGASRQILIRRAAFDLTGLPPSAGEVERFLRDPAPDRDAFARVVDDYLASKHFGERWARHWLDVAHYADSSGRTWNAPFVYAWRYRDWVIRSLNQDKPYNRFIAEQIAGDLLPATTVAQRRDQVTGTGFLALGSFILNGGGNEQFILDQVDDQIDVTTRAFLGLSVACARCHDHKYDPVSQIDYYAMAGIFYSSWTYSGTPHVSEHAGNGYVDPEMLVRLPADLDSKLDRVRDIPGGIHAMSDLRQFGGKAPPPFDIAPDWVMGMRDGKPVNCELRRGGQVWDRDAAPPRGDIKVPGLPGFPSVPESASGRLELAKWIARPDHPLTARVMANRVWQHLFGQGLVETVDNFGVTGREPSHPELLDHLAVRFVEDGWSVKRFIRHIMLSRTYQLAGEAQTTALEKDPSNGLYWRRQPRRLELEPLRDAMLSISGQLSADPPEPGALAGNGNRGNGRIRSQIGFDSPYRTIYLPVIRDQLPDEYGTFDFPDPSTVSGLRHVTTSPPQALFFLNSRFVEDAAAATATRIVAAAKSGPQRVEFAWQLIFCRPPEREETDDAIAFMNALDSSATETERWAMLVRSLFSTAEFRHVF